MKLVENNVHYGKIVTNFNSNLFTRSEASKRQSNVHATMQTLSRVRLLNPKSSSFLVPVKLALGEGGVFHLPSVKYDPDILQH